MHIGKRLKEILKEKGISQSELANKMGVSKQMISSMMSKESITTDTLENLLKSLNISISYFFNDNASTNSDATKELEALVKKYRYVLLLLRSYINNAAVEGRGAISIKFQEDIALWNIVWGELKKPISMDHYKEIAKDINDELNKL
jgi:transcriptional regulator with XRE-family HTH domain